MVDGSNSTENLDETPGVAAQRLFNNERQSAQHTEIQEHSNDPPDDIDDNEGFGDPSPPPRNASVEEKRLYSQNVNDYGRHILNHFMNIQDMKGKELWIEFTCSFREKSIVAISSTLTLDWARFLRRRGVQVTMKRGTKRTKALLECLQAEEFTPFNGDADPINENSATAIQPPTHPPAQEKSNSCAPQLTRADDIHNANIRPPETNSSNSSGSIASRRAPLEALMKAYSHQKKYSGSFVEDFESSIEQYNTYCQLFELNEEEKAKGFPIMLTGAAFAHYSRQFAKKKMTYAQLSDAFRSWYTSEEQKKRLLNIWQTPSLTRELQSAPDKSELEVFQKLSEQLVKVQNQLHSDYHQDRFLRDQLIRAADIPHLQHSLNDKVPETAQEAMHRIANRLSAEPKSAGANVAQEDEDHDNYGIGMKFGGNARRSLKKPYHRSSKTKLSKLLASKKGCYVCGRDHRARQAHSLKEVLSAIERIKQENPSVLFSVDEVIDMQYAIVSTRGTEEDDLARGLETDSDDDEVNYVSADNRDSSGRSAQTHFANAAFAHGRTYATDLEKELKEIEAALSIGEKNEFRGIIMDTAANRSSVMSHSQYKAYCEEFHVPMQLNRSEKKTICGLNSKNPAIGTAVITIPFKDLDLWIDVKFRIMAFDCPTLLSMKDMVDNGLDISVQNKWVSYKHKLQDLAFENYFLIHRWSVSDSSFYTEPELRKLHRVFGHPSVTALKYLLRRADPGGLNDDVKTAVHDITKQCMTCATYAAKPRRFKVTIGTDELKFNHILAVDIMYINNKPVIHVVDEATHYQAALFLRRVNAEETWKAILKCWIRVYLGPPDHLRVDQGSNFVSKHFRDSADAEGITLLEAPIECPSTMSHVERYHAPLRSAYNKLRDTLPRSETDIDCLQMAVKAVNDTIGPEGLFPTLIVYGTLPRPLRRTPAETQIRRAEALDSAIKEVQKEQAKRKIAFALRHSGGPKAKEQEQELQRLPAGSPVLVYREKSKKWEGPFPFVTVDGSTVVVQMPTGRKIFRSSVVKSSNPVEENDWVRNASKTSELEKHNTEMTSSKSHQAHLGDSSQFDSVFIMTEEIEEQRDEQISSECLRAMFGAENVEYMNPSDDRTFRESRITELNGLINRKTFEVVKRDSVPPDARIYGTRWVDCIKTVNGKKIDKSRLVAQNYRDHGATSICTKSPTVSRMGQRVAITTAALTPSHKTYVRDISQAYVQSQKNLERHVYLKPPKEMELAPEEILLARKPLYGIPESGLHWFLTYQGHHTDKLEMQACQSDPCVSYRTKPEERDPSKAVTVLQVDDAFGHGNERFLAEDEEHSKRFLCKPRKLLKTGDSAQFNGSRISVLEDSINMDQSLKLKRLKQQKGKDDLVSVRAQIQYIASCTRPDLCAAVQLMASEVVPPVSQTFKKMESIVKRCHETQDIGLRFVPQDNKSLRLALFTDASFANTERLKSQIAFVLILVDGYCTANILHYGSAACNRVTRSVMAAELLALVHGFDIAYVLQQMLQDILGKSIPIDGYLDSRTVFNVIAKNGPTLEKRLQIDAFALRESHSKGELRSLAWIDGKENAADGLTKGLIDDNHPLWKLMITNRLSLKPQGWVHKVKTATKEKPGV